MPVVPGIGEVERSDVQGHPLLRGKVEASLGSRSKQTKIEEEEAH